MPIPQHECVVVVCTDGTKQISRKVEAQQADEALVTTCELVSTNNCSRSQCVYLGLTLIPHSNQAGSLALRLVNPTLGAKRAGGNGAMAIYTPRQRFVMTTLRACHEIQRGWHRQYYEWRKQGLPTLGPAPHVHAGAVKGLTTWWECPNLIPNPGGKPVKTRGPLSALWLPSRLHTQMVGLRVLPASR